MFKPGDIVILTKDIPSTTLREGDVGKVYGYAQAPFTALEIEFESLDGVFSMRMGVDENWLRAPKSTDRRCARVESLERFVLVAQVGEAPNG